MNFPDILAEDYERLTLGLTFFSMSLLSMTALARPDPVDLTILVLI
jgi:hypothetical protein